MLSETSLFLDDICYVTVIHGWHVSQINRKLMIYKVALWDFYLVQLNANSSTKLNRAIEGNLYRYGASA